MKSRRQFIRLAASCSALGLSITGTSRGRAQQEGGTERWSFDIENGVRSSPTVINQAVFIGGLDGHVYALNTDDGTERWRYDTGGNVFSSPMVVGDRLYIGSYSGYLHAIDISSGSEEWRFDTGDGIQVSSPTYYDGVLYVGAVNSNVYAIDALSGTQRWEFTTDDRVDSSPIVTEEAVYISSRDGNLYSIDRTSGGEIWRFEANDEIPGAAPALDDGTVYIGSEDEHLYAIDQQTGEEVWRFRGEPYGIIDSPTVANGDVFIGDTSGTIYCLSTEGDEKWRYTADGLINSGPTVADDIVYVGSNDGSLYAISADDGSFEWDISLGETIRSSPTVVDGTVYVGSQPGGLHAIRTGHNLSSVDSRVTIGALGHHESFNPDTAGSGATVFQEFSQRTDTPILWALAVTGSIGGGYIGYKKFYQSQDTVDVAETTPTNNIKTSTNDERSDNEPVVQSYDEIQLYETAHKADQYIVHEATVDSQQIWVLTQNTAESETIDSKAVEACSKEFEQWPSIDSHPHLLTVFESGFEPMPWAAVERTDYSLLVSSVNDLTTKEILDILNQVCEVLHHVHRYGTPYDNLTTNSILQTDDNLIKLRGLLDQFETPDLWYNAPEEFESPSTERSVVYRIGLIAYELLTGTLPYATYPNGDPKTVIRTDEPLPPSEQIKNLPDGTDQVLLKALNKTPSERHETVLHLRDEFQTLAGD